MAPAIGVILASLTTFAATNIDDLAVLTLFFAHQVPTGKIVLGQCLGFTLILVLSLGGFLAAIFIPSTWVRFLGLLPLAIGLKDLVRVRRNEARSVKKLDLFSIVAVTVANGGDNIGVYVPFFALNQAHLGLVLLVYAALLPLLFLAGNWLGNHAIVLRSVNRYGHYMVPLVFIGLGIFVLVNE